MPASAAGFTSFLTSTLSGSFNHRKMPPFGFHKSAVVPNSRSTASIIVSSFSFSTPVRAPTCLSKYFEKYSATII